MIKPIIITIGLKMGITENVSSPFGHSVTKVIL